MGLRCGGCASSAGGSVRVREAIGDYIVVVVGAQRGGKPRQRVRADEGRGREGRGGEWDREEGMSGGPRRRCPCPAPGTGGMRAWLAAIRRRIRRVSLRFA